MKRFLLITLFIGAASDIIAQESTRKWVLGMRTGVYIEMANASYYGSASNISSPSWSQQGFIQKKIKDRFLLEMTVTHFSVAHTLDGEKKNALEQPYLSYSFRHQRFAHSLSILYKLVSSNKLEIYGGLGAGIISSLERYNYSFIDTLGHYKKEKNSLVSIEAINFSGMLSANYSIAARWLITGNTSFSFLRSGQSLSGYSLNFGMGYRL